MTLLLAAFFPFCSCWFQMLLCKSGQENKKWFKFSYSHVGRSIHLLYIKHSLDQRLPQLLHVIHSVKPTLSTLKNTYKSHAYSKCRNTQFLVHTLTSSSRAQKTKQNILTHIQTFKTENFPIRNRQNLHSKSNYLHPHDRFSC